MEETIITPTDAQKIQTILDEIPISPYRLTQELKLSSGAIYHILSGKNNLSKNIIDKICLIYPEVSKKYLLKGIGEPIIEPNVSKDSEYVLVKREELDQVKKDIKNLYDMLQKLQKK